MKNCHQCWIIVLLLGSLLSIPMKSLAQSSTAASTPEKTDPNSYEHAYIPVKAYKTGADLFRSLFKVRNEGNAIDSFLENETFEVTNFKEIQKFKLLVASASKDTLEAFEIKYGLKLHEGKYRLVFIYIPHRLIKQPPVSSARIPEITYEPSGYIETDTNYHILIDSVFTKLVDRSEIDSAKAWMKNYDSLIRIDRKNDGVFASHLETDTMDATGQIFGFKEVEHFFGDTDAIYLTSWANIDLRNGISIFRHSIAIANGAYNGDLANVHAADMGTMCPPNCLKMIFRAGRNQGLWESNLNSPGNHLTPKPKNSTEKLTWILITLGCLLIGFIIGRLLKRK